MADFVTGAGLPIADTAVDFDGDDAERSERHVRSLRAYVEAAPEGEADAGVLWFRASTEGVKRDGLNLIAAGARYDNFMRNPVFLWAHDYGGERLPIGRVVEFMVKDDYIRTGVVFDQEDEFARKVESKYRRGFLSAVSIGWNILDRAGRDVTSWDVLDVSAVPVPGDPDALMERARKLATDDADAEAEWPAVAAEMADAVWWPFPDDAEARQRRYRALLPAYRRMGKVAPELLPLDRVRAIGAQLTAGLFLNNEMQAACETDLARTVTAEQLGEQVAQIALGIITEKLPELIKAATGGGEQQQTPETDDGNDAGLLSALETIAQQLETLEE